jgi:hypothetical protein
MQSVLVSVESEWFGAIQNHIQHRDMTSCLSVVNHGGVGQVPKVVQSQLVLNIEQ